MGGGVKFYHVRDHLTEKAREYNFLNTNDVYEMIDLADVFRGISNILKKYKRKKEKKEIVTDLLEPLADAFGEAGERFILRSLDFLELEPLWRESYRDNEEFVLMEVYKYLDMLGEVKKSLNLMGKEPYEIIENLGERMVKICNEKKISAGMSIAEMLWYFILESKAKEGEERVSKRMEREVSGFLRKYREISKKYLGADLAGVPEEDVMNEHVKKGKGRRRTKLREEFRRNRHACIKNLQNYGRYDIIFPGEKNPFSPLYLTTKLTGITLKNVSFHGNKKYMVLLSSDGAEKVEIFPEKAYFNNFQ